MGVVIKMRPERFAEMREKSGLTQAQLAEILNMTTRAISAWETGDRKPPIDKLEWLADYYNVSVDYLLGRTDIPNIYIHDIHEIEADGKHGRIASTQKDLSPEYQEQVRTKIQNAIKEDRGVKISASDLPSSRAELEALVQRIVNQALKKPDDHQ